jgi:signal transduction histidine kinase
MTPDLDAPVHREERRFRRARLVFACVVTVTLLQIGWWIFFQIRTTNREYDNERLLGRDPVEAEAQRSRRVRMTASEGGFLLLAVIGGVASIWWLMRRELRREYEQNQLLAADHDFRSPLTAIRLLAQSFGDEPRPQVERAGTRRRRWRTCSAREDLVENVLSPRASTPAASRRAASRPIWRPRSKCRQRAAPFAARPRSTARRRAACACCRPSLQSIGNLVDNALKFADGTPHIALSLARDGARAVLRVRDRGVGFAPEEAGRLFERFHRGGAEQDVSRPGLGLGLFLVREFARLSGGDVVATSDGPGRGSEFVVMLPLAGDAPASAPAPAGAPA